VNELVLHGCSPVPLAHYLKALGVLRLVAEQKDPTARGYWKRDRFVLVTSLDRGGLERFLLDEYQPTPITGPWNGGSGYFDKDNTQAIDALMASNARRFEVYRETINAARSVLTRVGLSEKPSSDQKERLLCACRAAFPDQALKWLDATFVLSDDGAKFPPLLGTGGNDGRLEFTNNFMQRLLCLFDAATGIAESNAAELLKASLFGEATTHLAKGAPIGQFLPGNAGGVNATASFNADSLINSWDFVLMLEGATLFAAAAAHCMEQDTAGVLTYPFTVRPAGVGYESAASNDESSGRAEMWVPLWCNPTSLPELAAVMSEGRARVGGRAARNGVDFARAVAGLGIDRGIDAFQRYGFHARNGLSYFAVPIGRFEARAEPRAALLEEIDTWLDRFRGRANGNTAPASAARAVHQLEATIFDLCLRGDVIRQQAVLIALGRCERVLAISSRWTKDSELSPVPALSGQWLSDCDDGSVEYRLASALASVWGYYESAGGKPSVMSIRQQLEPVTTWKVNNGLAVRWDWDATSDVVWTHGNLADSLNAVMQRRLMRGVQAGVTTYPDVGHVPADLSDVSDFIDGTIDEKKLSDLLWGCMLIDWTRMSKEQRPRPRTADGAPPGALYAVLKLCFAGDLAVRASTGGSTQHGGIPIVPRVHRAAAGGDGERASAEALRRLRGSGLSPALATIHLGPELARRTAAALLFPIDYDSRQRLAALVLRPPKSEQPASSSSSST
jgi:CRISPR-associated protein Csx17